MPSRYMGAETKGIGQLIEERKTFRVPDHQRDFTWPVGAVEQYLDDVSLALDTGAPHYFMGLLVLVDADSDGAWKILDGQQRIATTTMVYAAMRHWMRENGFSPDAELLQRSYIGVAELGQSQHRPRLTMNVNNSSVFEELVVNQASDELLEKRKRESWELRLHLDLNRSSGRLPTRCATTWTLPSTSMSSWG